MDAQGDPEFIYLKGDEGHWSILVGIEEFEGTDPKSAIESALGEGAFDRYHMTADDTSLDGERVITFTPRDDGRPGLDGR